MPLISLDRLPTSQDAAAVNHPLANDTYKGSHDLITASLNQHANRSLQLNLKP